MEVRGGSMEVGGGSCPWRLHGDLHGGLHEGPWDWRPPRTFTDLFGAPHGGPWMSMMTPRLFYVYNN